MAPIILRDSDATNKLLEIILDSPGGKRSLSRFARTCKGFADPSLAILWRELDSILPIIGLFPGHLLKKIRRPGMGLSRNPNEEDWKTIMKYSEYIEKITYIESANNVAPSIFSILDEHRPNLYILPRLQELTWKVNTAAGLERCTIFINPSLQVLNLEVGAKIPKLNDFLTDMSSRTKLKGFSFISPVHLPEAFTELLLRQNALEKVVLTAPGALSSGVGRWSASLPELKNLQLDLTGRSPIAVEGFFDELRPRSGASTPSSINSRDSGVFSAEEFDFAEIRKSALRLTGDVPPKGVFNKLKRLQLTGEVANIAVFLKHLDSDLVHLDLVIEDPPDNADWQDLSELICENFANTLQSIRITPTQSSKYVDLVRSTSRAEPPNGRLSLEKLAGLHNLVRFEVDLPDSVVFIPADIQALAKACPNVELVKLCPLARFPLPHTPKITLEDLVPLISGCRRLHTLAAVFNAAGGSEAILRDQHASSPSLLRLHTGHSWAHDHLQISIFLSHLAPRLELVKWFQDKNRGGLIEAHAKAWQNVSDTLPHLQRMRAVEKSFCDVPIIIPPTTAEKSVDASVPTKSCGISATPQVKKVSVQVSPALVSREVEAITQTAEVYVDAVPPTKDIAIEAQIDIFESTPADLPTTKGKTHNTFKANYFPLLRLKPASYLLSSIVGLLAFAYRATTFPLTLTSRILHLALGRFRLPAAKPTAGFSVDSMQMDKLPARP